MRSLLRRICRSPGGAARPGSLACRSRILPFLLAAGLQGCGIPAGGTSSDTTPTDREPQKVLSAQVDELFREWDRPGSPGAVVGVFGDGRIVYMQGYGAANLDHGVPLSPRSVLRIGSISKQFVALGIALLAEEQKLSLGDDIRTYLPEMPSYGKPITIRHLLHHTSGIREYLTLVGLIGQSEGGVYGYTSDDLLALLSRQTATNFEPGERFSYTNSGYFLLAQIIARVSGMKTNAFAKERIFDPLGMSSTRFYDDPTAIMPNLAYGYSRGTNDGYRLDILRSDVIGDLGVVTTVEDFFYWDSNFYDNKLGAGGSELVETVQRRGRTASGEELPYAGGLEWGSYRGLTTVGHSGSAVGYVADFVQFPEERFSVVVFSNFSEFRPGRMAYRIADLYLADRFTEVPSDESSSQRDSVEPLRATLSATELEQFVGYYYSEELDFIYSLSVAGGDLELEVRGQRMRLLPESEDRFRGDRLALDFEKSDQGASSGFRVNAGEVRDIYFERVKSRRPRS